MSRMKGELHPTETRLRGRLWHLVRVVSHIDDGVERSDLCSLLGAVVSGTRYLVGDMINDTSVSDTC